MTELSIRQTRVKYPLKRSPPPKAQGGPSAKGGRGTPWGPLSRGEAHLGALMRFSLSVTLR